LKAWDCTLPLDPEVGTLDDSSLVEILIAVRTVRRDLAGRLLAA
jgi:hypothetical protein